MKKRSFSSGACITRRSDSRFVTRNIFSMKLYIQASRKLKTEVKQCLQLCTFSLLHFCSVIRRLDKKKSRTIVLMASLSCPPPREALAPFLKNEEAQLQSSARSSPFHYVLCASTSPAVKQQDETLTYLNQGRYAPQQWACEPVDVLLSCSWCLAKLLSFKPAKSAVWLNLLFFELSQLLQWF